MHSVEPVTVCLVEDEPAIREAIANLFQEDGTLQLLGSFPTAEAATIKLPALAPRVVISDISLPGHSGIDLVQQLALIMPGCLFLMYTMHDDDHRVFEALKVGAHGYILKGTSGEHIIKAIHELVAGGAPMSTSVARRVIQQLRDPAGTAPNRLEQLTSREREVLELLAEGLLYKEIGERLSLSVNTVGQHVHHIYGKLHVQNRTEALNKFLGR